MMKFIVRLTRSAPVEAPPTDPEALRRARDHVAKQRRETDARWDTVRSIAGALAQRNEENGLAELILGGRRRRGVQ